MVPIAILLGERKLDALAKTLNSKVSEIEARMFRMSKASYLEEEERGEINRAIGELGKYRQSVAKALDLGAVDPATGAAMMGSADEQFTVLRAVMDR